MSYNEIEIKLEEFCEFLDMEGPVSVCGIEFDRSRILQRLDPIAFRTAFNEYCAQF